MFVVFFNNKISETVLQNRAIRIEAVAREQMERYEKYIKKLQDKVEKQREDRKISDEELNRRMKAREEEVRISRSTKRQGQVMLNPIFPMSYIYVLLQVFLYRVSHSVSFRSIGSCHSCFIYQFPL